MAGWTKLFFVYCSRSIFFFRQRIHEADKKIQKRDNVFITHSGHAIGHQNNKK